MPFSFAPRWYFVLLAVAAVALFIALGRWQWQRGEYRSAQWQDFARADRPAMPAGTDGIEHLPRFSHVTVYGEFDTQRQFLLDNISHAGKPGYQVLSVLRLADGGNLLVNRGWLPFTGVRDRLPDVALAGAPPRPAAGADAGGDSGAQRIAGRLSTLPVAGISSGRQPPSADAAWPRLTSFPTHQELQAALGVELLAPVLLLDADSGPGYLRDWRPPGIPPARHYAYAVQWWAFALLAAGLLIGFNLKRRNG